MNRKLITGWLLIALGLAQVGGGIVLARAEVSGGTELAQATAPGGTAMSQAEAPERTELADPNLVRIHVIAHSDAEADQALKLAVRDAVLARLRPALAGADSRAAAEEVIRSRLGELERAAAAVITAWGFTYPVRAELGTFAFPGKAYDGRYLPAGRYRALRILIGDAAGANFWCLVYPSFCYTIREVQAPEAGLGRLPHASGSGRAEETFACQCICPL